MNKLKHYQSLREFLADSLASRKNQHSHYSLRAWAKQLGYRNPSLLSDVLTGRRKPSKMMLQKISANLKLTDAEEGILFKMGQRESSSQIAGKKTNKTPSPAQTRAFLELDEFRLISDWHYLAILELFLLRGFKPTAEYICHHLFRSVPKVNAESALNRLERLELISKSPGGELRRTEKATSLFIGKNISNAAIQNHHSQTIELAMEALTKQAVNERDFSGSTVALTKANFQKVRTAIYELHSLINQLSAEPGYGDAVYRLNIQLFRLDKDKKKESGT